MKRLLSYRRGWFSIALLASTALGAWFGLPVGPSMLPSASRKEAGLRLETLGGKPVPSGIGRSRARRLKNRAARPAENPLPAEAESVSSTPDKEELIHRTAALERSDVLKERGGVYGYNAPGYGATLEAGKVSFALPMERPDRSQPYLSYALETVRMDGQVLAGAAKIRPKADPEARTVTYRRGAVEEQYRLEESFAEQLFVIHHLPPERGAITITGRVETNLTPPLDGARGERLSFRDGGEERMALSKALAYDEAGRKLPLELRYGGGRVSMTLSREWVSEATLPITVDPLIEGTIPVDSDVPGSNYQLYDVAYNSVRHEWFVVWFEQFGASPLTYDVYGQRISSTGERVGQGFWIGLTIVQDDRPTVSFNPANDQYLVAWVQADDQSPYTDRVAGRLVNGDGFLPGSEFVVKAEAGYEHRPSAAFDGTNWYVSYTEETVDGQSQTTDYNLRGRFVSASGTPGAQADPPAVATIEAFSDVAFADGIYLIAWESAGSLSDYQSGTDVTIAAGTMTTGGTFQTNQTVDSASSGRDVDVEAGGDEFLISWIKSGFDVRARISDSALSFQTAVLTVASGSSEPYGVQSAYSSTDQEWTVVYGDPGSAGDIKATRLDGTGTALGSESIASGSDWEAAPRASWNALTNEALVVYASATTAETAPFQILAQRHNAVLTTPSVLLVVGDYSEGLNGADVWLINRLTELGFDVRLESDEDCLSTDADGKDLVILPTSVDADLVGTTYRDVAVPVLSWEVNLYGPLGMTGSDAATDYGTAPDQDRVLIASPTHPLANTFSGDFPVTTDVFPMTWGAPNTNATLVASLNGDATKAAIFVYETGDWMEGVSAPARRIGFFLGDGSAEALLSKGEALLDAAILYAVDQGIPPQPPPAPRGLAAVAGDEEVSLSWLPSFGATLFHVYRRTAGTSFGSPVASVTGAAYVDTGLVNDTEYFYVVSAEDEDGEGVTSAEVSARPSVAQEEALFVVYTTNLSDADQAIQDRLVNLGYGVVVVDDAATTSADATGKSLVFISGSVSAGSVGAEFRDVTVPVIVCEQYLFDDMEMTTSQGYDSGETALTIVDDTHELAAGLTGTVTILSSAEQLVYGVPNANAAKIATTVSNSSRWVIFGYDTGAEMINAFTAPARRVGFFLSSATAESLDPNGDALFDAAVAWATEGGTPGSPPAAPTGLTAAPDDGQIALTWNASVGATSYNVYRRGSGEAYGDPYATVSVPTYTDIETVNGTPYYYVVRAVNSVGEGSASVEISATSDVQPLDVLLVAGSVPLNAGDAALRDRIEDAGVSVVAVNDNDVVTADADGKVLVVISSSVSQSYVSTKFRDVTVPVIVCEYALFDEMAMAPTGSSNQGRDSGENAVTIQDETHPLAAGLTGTVTILDSNNYFTWGNPNANADKVATISTNSARWAVFAFEKDALMEGALPAPARRVGLFVDGSTSEDLNANGKALVAAALEWALASGPPTTVPAAPKNLTASAGYQEVTLTWQKSYSATSYNVYRRTSGSSYGSPIATVTDLYFTDTGLTNQTEYFYVVKAVNVVGEGAPSVEVSATPDVLPPKALFVVGNLTLPDADTAIQTQLVSLGFDVTVVSHGAATVADAAGKDLIFISATVSASTLGATFRDVTVPAVTCTFELFDEMALTSTGSSNQGQDGGESTVTIVDPVHPMAAGLSGNVLILSAGHYLNWGNPNANADEVVSILGNADRSVVFGYDTGAEMIGSVIAPERRVGFFLDNATAEDWNDNGKALFDAAVLWALGFGTPVDPPPAPRALAVTPGNQELTLDWLASLGATSYNVYRRTAGTSYGAPIATVTTPGYLDAQVVNGTQYFYVVAAQNAVGESVVSAEASGVPDVQPPKVLLTVATLTLAASELAIKDQLENLGLTVVLAEDGAAESEDADGMDLVFITPTGWRVNAEFRDVAVPVLCGSSAVYDDMKLIQAGGTRSSQTAVTIVDDQHPLAAGFTGNVTILNPAEIISWGLPNANALKIATTTASSTEWTVFGFGEGAEMEDSFIAPARRLAFFLTSGTAVDLTDDGRALLDAAVLWALEDATSIIPTDPPPAPRGLKARSGYLEIDLEWNPSFGADSYNIYRRTSGGSYGAPIATVTGTSYTDSGVVNGTEYFYRVGAVNQVGEGVLALEVSRIPNALPDGIDLFQVNVPPGGDSIEYHWLFDSDDLPSTDYALRDESGNDTYFTVVPTRTYLPDGPWEATWSEYGLKDNTRYVRTLIALNGQAESPATATPVVITTAIVASHFTAAATSPTEVGLDIVPPRNPYLDQTGFVVYRNGSQLGYYSQDYAGFRDSGLEGGQQYTYSVVFRNADGVQGMAASAVTVTTPDVGDPILIAPLGGNNIGQSPSSILWGWGNVPDETGYELLDENLEVITTLAADVTTYTETGLDENVEYTRHVRAFNDSNVGPSVGPKEEWTLVHDPTAQEVSVVPLSSTSIEVSALPPPNAWAGSTGWQLQRSDDEGQTWTTLSTDSSYLYVDTGLTPSTPYDYRVRFRNGQYRYTAYSPLVEGETSAIDPPVISTPSKKLRTTSVTLAGTADPSHTVDVYVDGVLDGTATNTSGNWSYSVTKPEGSYSFTVRGTSGMDVSPHSGAVYIEVDMTPPSPPTNIRTYAYSGAVDVEWDASASLDTVGYQIWRKVGAGSWSLLNPSALVVGTKYRDDTVTNGTEYTYGVEAVDDAVDE